MSLLSKATWPEIERLRGDVAPQNGATLQAASQTFVSSFCEAFSTIVLARLFIVLPFERLPERERTFARRFVGPDREPGPATRVLTLLGTHGHEKAWNDRALSKGHLSIPLLDRKFVQAAPMIAKLLADIDVDLAAFDDGSPIATRRLLGGNNAMFFVPDAATAKDQHDRYVIPDRVFVDRYQIHTVFGMAGAYLDGTLAIAVIFSSETLDRLAVDRFPSLIGTFKISTSKLVEQRLIFDRDEP